MKLWVLTGTLPSGPNSYGYFSCHALHAPCRPCLCIVYSYLTRRMIRMINPRMTRKRGILFFSIPVYSHRTRHLLCLLPPHSNLTCRHHHHFCAHGHCIHGICLSMGPNKPLSCNRDYKLTISNPSSGKNNCRVSLRRVCS